ncbi:TOBE domain-containing protein [Antarctobacter sp.]|uniref:TOBE domain-containing protein n=1 Tax=Antarctobacter sp. TaxID=1872577 RepID=UPI003A92E285
MAEARPEAPEPPAAEMPEPAPATTPEPVTEPATAPAPHQSAPQPNDMGRALHDRVLSPIFGKWIDDEQRRLPPPSETETEAPTPAPAAALTPAQHSAPDLPAGGLAIHWAEGHSPVIATNGDPAMAGQPVVIALRPEKVGIAKQRPDAPNTLRGKVIDIAYLGNISTYHVEIEGGTMIKAQAANTRRISRRDITWEDEVWLSFSATAGVVLKDA